MNYEYTGLTKRLWTGNDFHGTEVPVSMLAILDDYEIEGGGVVVISKNEYLKLRTRLCGMEDCRCTGPHNAYDDDGRVYRLKVTREQ